MHRNVICLEVRRDVKRGRKKMGLAIAAIVLFAVLASAWQKGGPQPMRWIEAPVTVSASTPQVAA